MINLENFYNHVKKRKKILLTTVALMLVGGASLSETKANKYPTVLPAKISKKLKKKLETKRESTIKNIEKRGFDKKFAEKNILNIDDEYVRPPSSGLDTKANEYAKVLTEVLKDTKGSKLPPKVEIILDSSGSMGQELGGNKTKMYYSKKLLQRFLIDQWKQKAYVGLRVYGSRKRNDCSDNYLAVKFKTRGLEKIEKVLANLIPVGMTPLHDSVEAAMNDLKNYKGPKRIVIFTDGVETCGGDPCKLTKKIELNPKIDIKVYVVAIGFTQDSKDFDKVECLGETHLANSEDDFFNATGAISNKIYKRNNLVVKSPDPTASVALYRVTNGKRKYFRHFTASWGVKIPPGDYEAEVMLNPIYKFPKFTIKKGIKTTLVVEGKGEVYIKFVKNLMNVELLDKHSKVVHSFKSDRRYVVSSGRYKLRIFKKPYFSQIIENFVVVPNGKHFYPIGEAGVVQFDHKDFTGLYVYDLRDKLLGSYVTNTPLVFKSGTYRMYVNDNCFDKAVQINGDQSLQRVSCPLGKKAK